MSITATTIKDLVATVLGALIRKRLCTDQERKEHPDPTPVFLAGKSDRPPEPRLNEEIKRYIRSQLQIRVAPEAETFEEANDLEIDEVDIMPSTIYQDMAVPQGDETGYEVMEDIVTATPPSTPSETAAQPPAPSGAVTPAPSPASQVNSD